MKRKYKHINKSIKAFVNRSPACIVGNNNSVTINTGLDLIESDMLTAFRKLKYEHKLEVLNQIKRIENQ